MNLATISAIGEKRNRPAVRPPAGMAIAFGAVGQLPWLVARRRDQPDCRLIVKIVSFHGRGGVSNGDPVWTNIELLEDVDASEIARGQCVGRDDRHG